MRHDERFDERKIGFIEFISFLIGFSSALLAYIMSEYFHQASGSENVGVFYAIAYGIVLVGLLNLHKLVKKLGKSNIFYFSLLAKIITVVALIFLDPSLWSAGVMVVYIIFETLQWVSLDVILESFSEDKVSGRVRGLHLTIFNLGFLSGPFLSTTILKEFGFPGVFLFLLLFNSIVFVLSLIFLRNVNHKFDQDLKVLDLLKKVWKRKDVMKIYYVSFVLELFFALMMIYTTLHLLNLGFSLEMLGKSFTIMLIPFVVLQYPMGFLADKKTGEKEFLMIALFVMGAATIAMGITNSKTFLVWTVLLFLTRVGASLVEILRDSYFYKRIDGHDVDVINFFRTASSVGCILSAALSALLLLIFPIKAIFIFTGLVVFSAIFVAARLEDNKCEAELENCR